MIVLNAADARAALPIPEALMAMRWALAAWSSGRAVVPPRLHLDLPNEAGIGLVMPAFVLPLESGPQEPAYAVKTLTGMQANPLKGLPLYQGATLLLDPETGRCLAVIDAGALTAIRTGASAGVATDLLARHDASAIALIGAGVQGRAMLESICVVRGIKAIRIYDRTPERADRLCAELAGLAPSVTCAMSASEAVCTADIVCTATSSTEPLFSPEDIQEGAHINAIGSFQPGMREVPGATVRRTRVFADNAMAAQSESGDLVVPLREGLISPNHMIGEIGHLLMGTAIGRENEEQVTLYKSVGLATQDAVAALAAFRNAREHGIGQVVEW